MSIFSYVAAILMIVLGLGITELLKDLISTFRNRSNNKLHWLALVWAAIIFFHQIQFLWAIFELETLIHPWTAVKFIVMLLLGLHLFVAGALVVPRTDQYNTDAWALFQQSGRWSLAILSSYFIIAFIINPLFFGGSLLQPSNVLNLILSALLILMLFSRKVQAWKWGTLLYVVLATSEIILLSPKVYS